MILRNAMSFLQPSAFGLFAKNYGNFDTIVLLVLLTFIRRDDIL